MSAVVDVGVVAIYDDGRQIQCDTVPVRSTYDGDCAVRVEIAERKSLSGYPPGLIVAFRLLTARQFFVDLEINIPPMTSYPFDRGLRLREGDNINLGPPSLEDGLSVSMQAVSG